MPVRYLIANAMVMILATQNTRHTIISGFNRITATHPYSKNVYSNSDETRYPGTSSPPELTAPYSFGSLRRTTIMSLYMAILPSAGQSGIFTL